MPESLEPILKRDEPGSPELGKAIILPDAEEMSKRLRRIRTDRSFKNKKDKFFKDKEKLEDAFEDKFYPIILKEAGKELNSAGVALMFAGAVRDYIKQVYHGEKDTASLEAQALFANRVPQYVDALIDDKTIAAEVKTELTNVILHLPTLFPAKERKEG